VSTSLESLEKARHMRRGLQILRAQRYQCKAYFEALRKLTTDLRSSLEFLLICWRSHLTSSIIWNQSFAFIQWGKYATTISCSNSLNKRVEKSILDTVIPCVYRSRNRVGLDVGDQQRGGVPSGEN
jgi:hypothetical protein